LTSLVVCINDKFDDIRQKRDNKECKLTYEHPFPRVFRHQRMCDITEVDMTKFTVYNEIGHISLKGKITSSHIIAS
jgi:hypothetical protein